VADLFGSEPERLPLADAEISIHRDVPLGRRYDSLLRELIDETPWRAERIELRGRLVPQPRLIAWYGEPGAVYSYSGIRLEPEPWTPTLLDIRRRVERLLDTRFNSVLLNYYRDRGDSMGFHSDDEPELGDRPTIASLSLGEERRFQLRHRHRRDMKTVSVPLPDGSLLVMRGETQRKWKHGVPKERRPCGPRVNLTFRATTPGGLRDRCGRGAGAGD